MTEDTFTDERPLGARDEWVGGVNYSITHDQTGYRVTGAYSSKEGRYVLPGEPCHVCDEFGYWRDREPETFIGRVQGGDYVSRLADGKVSRVSWHVVRDVISAESDS